LPEWRVPLAELSYTEEEIGSVTEVLRSGWWTCGPETEALEREFERRLGVRHAVAVSSGTAALHLAFLALNLSPGQEVVTPAFNFVASANTILHAGALPRFADVASLEKPVVSAESLERALSPKTRGICVMHYGGYPCEMDAILDLARRRGLWVVEDAAHAPGAVWKGIACGRWGDIGCFSFYGNKILTTGEGGMVTTNDDHLAARVRFLKDHAMDPKRRYFHPEVGYNYRMTNIQAALGCAQLERADELLAKRRRVMDAYREGLADLEGVQLNPHAPWADPVPWMVCLVQDRAPTEVLTARLHAQGIDTRPFFVPMHELPAFHCTDSLFHGTSRMLATKGLNIPSAPHLVPADVQRICGALSLLLRSPR
jgi:perosamine synthetase